ncbi:MAG: argininosuccinate synthase [Actinomycetota bacterium]|nr:argininosuccinate synthase [Actinomycetota bacterium]
MNRILGDRAGRMRERLLSARLGNLDRQNERLRNEVSALHSRLDHEREGHAELRDALRSKPKEVKVRKSGFVRVVLIGGGAYLLGAHAGRERYDEVLRWARSLPDRMRRSADDVATQVDVGASKLEDRVEQKVADTDMASRRTAKLPNSVRS